MFLLFFSNRRNIRELSADNIQLAYGGISRIRASYYKDREDEPLHMYMSADLVKGALRQFFSIFTFLYFRKVKVFLHNKLKKFFKIMDY